MGGFHRRSELHACDLRSGRLRWSRNLKLFPEVVMRKVTTVALTLVELLVVIAIILVVAALSSAVFQTAKGHALRSSCASNLSQIGKALLLYAADNSQLAPPVVATTSHQYQDPQTKRLIPIQNDPRRWRDLLATYTQSKDVFFCPADPHARSPQTLDTTANPRSNEFTSYDTPFILQSSGWTITPQGIPLFNVDSPLTKVPYLADIVLLQPGQPHTQAYTGHGNFMNALYHDGHVKGTTVTDQ